MSQNETDTDFAAEVNHFTNQRVATTLGEAMIGRIAAETKFEVLSRVHAKSREHLMELSTDIDNLKARSEVLQPSAEVATKDRKKV